MPVTTLPPTPAPSTDIKGRDASLLSPLEPNNFSLPPSAVHSSQHGQQGATAHDMGSPASSSSPVDSKPSPLPTLITLPPPPSRARKIIHMKPKTGSEERDTTYTPSGRVSKAGPKDSGRRKSSAAAPGAAAGRKVARKTAHSIIERRRRSKMNEEFGVLKDMIPACRGCEMHKLAILQASIEYLRYLESCIVDLKAGRATSSAAPSIPEQMSANVSADEKDEQSDDDMEVDEHDDVSETTEQIAARAVHKLMKQSPALSPIAGQTMHRSSASSASVSTTTLPSPFFGPVSSHSSLALSQTTSPIFGPYQMAQDKSQPQLQSGPSERQARQAALTSPHAPWSLDSSRYPPQPRHSFSRALPFDAAHAHQPQPQYSRASSMSLSAQQSPAIMPQHQGQHLGGLNEAEASTALLMLNQDRRRQQDTQISPAASSKDMKRVLSVKDLLAN